MYQGIYYDRFNKCVHLWDDELGYHELEYVPYAYRLDEHGDYNTMDGKAVRKILKWEKDEVKDGQIYEHDVRPEMRMLIDLYDESDEVSTNHCIFYFDIEVAKEGRYSSPEDAANTITSIAFYDTLSKKHTCLILDKENRIDDGIIDEVKVITFETERLLLAHFISEWELLPITIVTGWNVLWYDLVYLYNRLDLILGKWSGKRLSPIGRVDDYTTKGGKRIFKIAGINILDYMELYKEMTFIQEPSYSLDNIAMKELKRGKVKYDKDLDDLYKTDPIKFIEYNVEDVKLVIDIDIELDFIAIAMGICHKGHVPYEDIFYTSRYMEGACLTETKRRGVVAIRTNFGGGEKADGAFVKRTKPGRYQWVYDLDLTSLYPFNIMNLNISPETKIAKVSNWSSFDYVAEKKRTYEIQYFFPDGDKFMMITYEELKKYLIDTKYCIAANGMIYLKHTEGLIPSLLRVWFRERADYKDKATNAELADDDATARFYNRKQSIQKVLLNSLYGVLLLPIFRFYDKDNGEAVTLTGQQLIQFTTKMANHYYNVKLKTEDIDYCLYTDTDSIFYEALPLIENKYPDYKEEEDLTDLTMEVAGEVQDFINKSYDIYGKEFHNLDKQEWNIKQELVAKRAFWGSAKKRYAMWLTHNGKKYVDKADIKGFDSVRSSFPKLFRSFLEQVIVNILKDANSPQLNSQVIKFKKGLDDYDILDIMSPTGVNGIEKWKPSKQGIRYTKGTPIHVKSAMNYNRYMADKNIVTSPKIQSGDKIKFCYLKDNPYDFDTIAIVGYDDPPEVEQFLEQYINRDKIFDKALEKKLQGIWNDLGWGKVIMNENVAKFYDFG